MFIPKVGFSYFKKLLLLPVEGYKWKKAAIYCGLYKLRVITEENISSVITVIKFKGKKLIFLLIFSY